MDSIKKYFVLIFIFCFASCQQKKSKNNDVDQSVKTEKQVETTETSLKPDSVSKHNSDTIESKHEEKANSNPDTLTVSGKSIVFFTISQPEYDSYATDPNSGIDEVLSDFEYYSNELADTLKKSGFNLKMTASRFLKFKMNDGSERIFDRLANDKHIVGRVYSDGNKMSISYGVATGIDILMELDDFLK